MKSSPTPAFVDASNDAADELAIDTTMQVWSHAERIQSTKVKRALKRDDLHTRKTDRRSMAARVRGKARATDILLAEASSTRATELAWCPGREQDITDFDYLFHHRERFGEQLQEYLEIINAKINHVKTDGTPGYFNKLETNVGWKRHITPIIFSRSELADKLVRCGLWANAKNSRRCHERELCANCLWNDVLCTLYQAYGVDSGSFAKARAWHLITIGWTTNPDNAKCISLEYSREDLTPPAADRGYDPYPVVLGYDDYDPDLPWLGYEDGRRLGVIMQEAVKSLKKQRLIDGFHSHHECDFRINPGGANRLHFHDHSVVNGVEDNSQFLAESTLKAVNEGLWKFGHKQLNQRFYPDIHVRRITDAEHLQHAICYTEKVIPIQHIVSDALGRPEARQPDGHYKPVYTDKVMTSLARLLDDDIPALYTGMKTGDGLPKLYRRYSGGNMRFGNRGTCIGWEPPRHVLQRHERAAHTRKSRRKDKQERAKQKREQKVRRRSKATVKTAAVAEVPAR